MRKKARTISTLREQLGPALDQNLNFTGGESQRSAQRMGRLGFSFCFFRTLRTPIAMRVSDDCSILISLRVGQRLLWCLLR